MMECPCGSKVKATGYKRHLDTRKHKAANVEDLKMEYNVCDCGCVVKVGWEDSHLKSKKHNEQKPTTIELMKTKFECPCGAVVGHFSKDKHMTTKKHQNYVKTST